MRRRTGKSAVKCRGLTSELPSILSDLSADEAGGMGRVAVKCLDMIQNTDCEGSLPRRN